MGCTPGGYRRHGDGVPPGSAAWLGDPLGDGLDSPFVAHDVIADVTLRSLHRDEDRPLSEWTTTFQLFLVALDPYTAESAAVLPSATRLLREYAEADCRTAFLMACDADDARQFLGPLTDELMVFLDPDRTAARALGLGGYPALVHVDQSPAVVAVATGWNPAAWREVALEVSHVTGWTPPGLPYPEDPAPFAATSLDGPPASD